MSRTRLRFELWLVVLLTFGMSGIRALLSLIDALLRPEGLAQQRTELHPRLAAHELIDVAFSLCRMLTLGLWGVLALYLLVLSGSWMWRGWRAHIPTGKEVRWGLGLAALIGLPGLAFYVLALHWGWTTQVIPADTEAPWWRLLVLTGLAAANACAEEVVVLGFVLTRLRELRYPAWAAILFSALLRASYHFYQGVSAGLGNFAMGLLLGVVYWRTGKVWPAIFAHFVIDFVAFVGYAVVGSHLDFL